MAERAGVQELVDVWRAAEMAAMPEKAFMAQVVEFAQLCGFAVYHTHDSRRSPAGFPDLVLAHPGRRLFLVAELKSEKGKLTKMQEHWIEVMRVCGIPCYVWRPRDMDEIARLLGPREEL